MKDKEIKNARKRAENRFVVKSPLLHCSFFLALLASLALTACKNDLIDLAFPQKKIVITGIESRWNNADADIKLLQLTAEKAHATSKISGGKASFKLLDEDGKPFTDKLGAYSITCTFKLLEIPVWAGIIGARIFTEETTTLSFSDFEAISIP